MLIVWKVCEPQPLRVLRACPGLYRDCFVLHFTFFHTTFDKNPFSVLEHKDRISAYNSSVICKEELRTKGYNVVTLISSVIAAPAVRGDVIWYITLAAPAECPIKVMLRGSPPNSSIFSRTHSNAKYWSSKPRFPLASESSRQKNPGNRTHIKKTHFLHTQHISYGLSAVEPSLDVYH